MKIERVDLTNVEEIARLFDSYRTFYNQTSDLIGATNFLKERIRNKESIIFAAKKAGEFVGFTQIYPTFSSVAMKPAFILNDLYVADHCRRSGVAEKLMEEAFEYAKKNKGRFITLETGSSNTKAQALYEKMGMEIEDDVKHYTYYW
ncbi:GNAT family N-acetyltransferase [Solibacillus sp. FSL K6-1523]|uniref:GNAT family N-acetyltransferase n=1 Tax=Solibacillus sp. FSL K6-1523 TaxID=2921471 RepID=UPI0030FA4A14